MAPMPQDALRDRYLRCSLISAGPVAQFNPITSTPRASRVERAAPISEPSSMVPVVSTVTLTRIGRSTPSLTRARFVAITAALACRRSWQVSICTASMPPAIMASTWAW